MARIELTQGLFSLVDDCDADHISQFSWHPAKSGKLVYAITTLYEPKQTLSIHRLIMAPPRGLVVDHINCDGLDNRRENLRVITQAENVRRRRPHGKASQYRGVSKSSSKSKPWWAMIRVNDKQKNLGSFLTEIEAAMAYDCAARDAWGPIAYQNFPDLISEYHQHHPLAKRGG